MMKYVFLLLFCFGCASQHPNNQHKQGVYGTVTEIIGNRMPSPELTKQDAQGLAVAATIHFYAPISTNSLRLNEFGLYQPLTTQEPIATCVADAAGKFRQSLPVGNYSVIIVLKDGWFAHQSNGNTVQPVEIKTGTWIEKNIQINYRAVY